METNEKRTGTRNLFIVAIVALLLVNVYTFFSYLSEKTLRESATTEISSLEFEFDHLSAAFDVANEELEQLKVDNAKTIQFLDAKESELLAQKKQIEGLLKNNKLSKSELAKAKTLLAQYEASIKDMSAQLQQLAIDNERLGFENQNLYASLETEKTLNTQLSEKNKNLADKVEVASLLPINNLDVDAVKMSVFGKEVTARKVKNAEGLRISFETGENKVLDEGTVSLYVRVINPKGETISMVENGPAFIQKAENAEPVMFTRQADIDWTKTNKKVLIYCNQYINEPGVYKVEIYQNGHVIGEREVKLS
jgi:hypothetical protein